MAVQQSLDAVGVSRAFLEQALAFPGAALAVFILNTRHVDHAAHPRLAPQIGEECPHQLLQIDPVGLGAPGAPVHLDAGGIDFMVDDTLSHQPSMQPVAVETRLVARQNTYRPAICGRLLAHVGKPGRQGGQVAATDRIAAQLLRSRQQHAEFHFAWLSSKAR
ncbi:hypothetical protein ACVWXO_005195 [Bradyrhizobium sp. LM2.7]